MGRVQTVTAAATIATTLALLQVLRRRRAPTAAAEAVEPPATQDQVQPQVRRLLPRSILATSVALSGLALWATHTLHPITENALHPLAAGLCVIMALVLSSYLLRGRRKRNLPGPRERNGRIVTAFAIILFIAQLSAIIYVTYAGLSYVNDPATILQLLLFGVVGMGIALCLAATWVSGWHFAEPLAVGIVSVALGAFCVPGVQALTAPLQVPLVNGAGELFVTGPQSPKVVLDVSVDPIYSNEEDFVITNNGRQRLNWVLLLVGDAELQPGTISMHPAPKGRHLYHDLFIDEPENTVPIPAEAQLFSGYLYPTTTVRISGTANGSFVSSNEGRSMVSLPAYGQGNLADVGHEPAALIKTSLGTAPAFANVALTVSGEVLGPGIC
jgi:hypothetical protein